MHRPGLFWVVKLLYAGGVVGMMVMMMMTAVQGELAGLL